MKKFLIIGLGALLSIGSISAYTVEIRNKTDKHLEVEVHLKACKNKKFEVSPGHTKKEGTKLCCIENIVVRKTEGHNQDWHVYKGFGTFVACKTVRVDVSEKVDGTLALEKGEK